MRQAQIIPGLDRSLASARMRSQDLVKSGSATASAASAGTGKGFKLNKATLPCAAKMMIERYDNEKTFVKMI